MSPDDPFYPVKEYKKAEHDRLEKIPSRPNYTLSGLSGVQREFIIDGTTRSSSRSKLESQIRSDKMSNIVARWRYLIEDLALLYESDFTETEDWEKVWDQIRNRDPNNGVYSSPLIKNTLRRGGFDFYEFGIEMGHLARLLSMRGDTKNKQSEIIFGFMMGLGGEFLSDLNSIEAAGSSDDAEQPHAYIFNGPEFVDWDPNIHEDIEQLYQDVTELITKSPPKDFRSQARKALIEADMLPCEPLQIEIVDCLLDQKPHYHSREDICLEIVQKLKSDQQFIKAGKMASTIREDIDILTDNKRGTKSHPIFAIEVLYGVCSEKDTNAEDIKQNVRATRRDKPATQNISFHRNNLEGRPRQERWDQYPLIKNVNGNYKPTDYGKLIGAILYPDAISRSTDEYLPGSKESDQHYYEPSDKELREACFAFAFGHPSDERAILFNEAYDERFSE